MLWVPLFTTNNPGESDAFVFDLCVNITLCFFRPNCLMELQTVTHLVKYESAWYRHRVSGLCPLNIDSWSDITFIILELPPTSDTRNWYNYPNTRNIYVVNNKNIQYYVYQISFWKSRSFADGKGENSSDSSVVPRTLWKRLKLLNWHRKQEPKGNITLNMSYCSVWVCRNSYWQQG